MKEGPAHLLLHNTLKNLWSDKHALEKEMATHSSVLVWRIPGTGEPGVLPSMGSHRVRHVWSDLAAAAALIFKRNTMQVHIKCNLLCDKWGMFLACRWPCSRRDCSLPSLIGERLTNPCLIDIGLGHVTCSGQWEISRHNISGGLKCVHRLPRSSCASKILCENTLHVATDHPV